MTSGRACGCGWPVPGFMPDFLVLAALGDHQANDCPLRGGLVPGVELDDGSPAARATVVDLRHPAPEDTRA